MQQIKKIAFIGRIDFANCMTEYSTAINQHLPQFESKIVCMSPHRIDYTIKHDFDIKNSTPSQKEHCKTWLSQCSHIIIGEEIGLNFNSINQLLDSSITDTLKVARAIKHQLGIDLVLNTFAGKQGNIHLYHTGSIYRNNFHPLNLIGGKHCNKVIYGNDLYRLAYNSLDEKEQRLFKFPKSYTPKNNIAVHVAFNSPYTKKDIKNIIEDKFSSNKFFIFHAPTSRILKGTDTIISITNEVVDQVNSENKEKGIDIEYQLITPENYAPLKEAIGQNGWIPNKEIIKTKTKSHIYIDEFNPRVGYFGVSGVESLMLGNITMATINNFTPEAEQSANSPLNPGPCPAIHLGTNPEEFKHILKATLERPIKELKELALQSMEWYFKTSEYKAVAAKFEKEILI